MKNRKPTIGFLVAVMSLFASSAMFANDAHNMPLTRKPVVAERQPFDILNLVVTDSVMLTHNMPVFEEQLLAVKPDATATSTSRRRAVRSGPSPSGSLFPATLDHDDTYGALSRVFKPLLPGDKLEYQVVRPDGSIALDKFSFIDIPTPPGGVSMSSDLIGSPWNGPIPSGSPIGIWHFRTLVTSSGFLTTIDNPVAFGVSVVPDHTTLDSLFVDAAGGIMLKFTGGFLTPPLVVSSSRVGMLSLSGGNYISPGDVPLPVSITSCSSLPGMSQNVYCSTKLATK